MTNGILSLPRFAPQPAHQLQGPPPAPPTGTGAHSRRPMIELLEERRLLSTTITVNTLSDPATPVAGQTSLREAIAKANGDPGGGDTIDFAPGLTGIIDLNQGALPVINAAMTISGPAPRRWRSTAWERSRSSSSWVHKMSQSPG